MAATEREPGPICARCEDMVLTQVYGNMFAWRMGVLPGEIAAAVVFNYIEETLIRCIEEGHEKGH